MDKKYKFLLSNHIVSTSLCLLMIIFCSTNFITGSENYSAFSLIIAPNGDPIASTISIAIVFLITILVVLVILSICLLFADFNLIEEPKTLDMLVKLHFILSLVLAILQFVVLICLMLKTSQLNRGQSGENMLGVGIVINFVFSLVLLCLSFALRFVDRINFDNFSK